MRLRKLRQHVTDENWFAVGLEFFIVVFGIFIGFQLTTWNENRKLDHAYEQARVRLVSETEANLEAVRQFIARNDTSLPVVHEAIGVLRSCAEGPIAEASLERGLNQIRGTQSITLRETALAALTQNEGLLSRQPEMERERLGEFYRTLIQTQETLDFLETLPFSMPMDDHPAVGMGDLETVVPSGNSGQGIRQWRLKLAVPLNEACKDAALAKHFYRWERVAAFQGFRAANFGN